VAKGPEFRDPDTGRALSAHAFFEKGKQVERDLARALMKRQRAGNALIHATTVRQERARVTALAKANAELARHRAREQKVLAQLGEPPRVGAPVSREWDFSVRYSSRNGGMDQITLRLARIDEAPIPYETARAVAREWRRSQQLSGEYQILGIDWRTPRKTYQYPIGRAADDAAISAHTLFSAADPTAMRLGKPR
jgi:hypothetical protein